MFWTGYIEKVGTGTEDIVNLCKEKGLKTPEYHQEEDFRVVIWRKAKRESKGKSKGESKGESKGRTKDKIKRAMYGNKHITLPEIANMLGLSLGAIEKAVRKMQESGEIKHIGPNKGGEWEVLD